MGELGEEGRVYKGYLMYERYQGYERYDGYKRNERSEGDKALGVHGV